MSEWRQKIRDVLKDVRALSFYSADPGGTALLKPMRKEAQDLGIAGTWFADGWAWDNADLPNVKRGDTMGEDLRRQASGQVIAMGQQVDFPLAHKRLQDALGSGTRVLMFSDHWEDISRLFRPTPSHALILPDMLYVPDERARAVQVNGMMRLGLTKKQCEGLIIPFVNPAIELSLEQMAKIEPAKLQAVRQHYTGGSRKLVLVVLDPERKEFSDYTWKDFLMDVFARISQDKHQVFLVKPHPRQDKETVAQYVASVVKHHAGRLHLVDGPIEPFLAAADEVWGMRSVALEIAKRAEKPVKSFPETDKTQR